VKNALTNHAVLPAARDKVPRAADDDCAAANALRRREFICEHTGATLAHMGSFSFDPARFPREHSLRRRTAHRSRVLALSVTGCNQ